MLSYTAQIEREKILNRQRQGIVTAKAKGVYKGRQSVYTEDSPDPQKKIIYNNILTMLKYGNPVIKIAKENQVSRETVYKIKRKLESNASDNDSETTSK